MFLPAGGAAGAEAGSEERGASDRCEQSGGGQRGGATTAEQSQGEAMMKENCCLTFPRQELTTKSEKVKIL